MRIRVAAVLLAGLSLLTAIVPAQTKRRVPQKGETSKPTNVTTKICQGVPIPDGYVIVAYMTSSACPHGAYLIKKQDPDTQGSPAPNRKVSQSSATTGSDQQPSAVAPTSALASTSAVPASSISRPRRVSTEESQPGIPTLSGAEPTAPLRPPTLAGPPSAGTPESESPKAVAAPGPEEVGEGEIVRVDTTLVTVPVSVLDRQGRFIPNLRKEDFSLYENGVEQPIAYFEPAEKPFTVALLLDTSASTHFHLSEIKEAAIAFAKQMRPQDRVLVVTFNDEVLLLTEATNNLDIISAVIEQNANTGSATRLYDAVDLVVNERLNKIKGRKAIVLFTDGVDTASRLATYQGTLREAEELDALIYPVQYDTTDYMRAMQGGSTVTVVTTSRGNWPFGGRSSQRVYNIPSNGGIPMPGTTQADYDRADQYLHALAQKSGGRLYEANDTTQLAQAFSQIAEELRRQYSLGYYPKGQPVEDGERREIRVRVHKPDLAVKAKESYVRSSSTAPSR